MTEPHQDLTFRVDPPEGFDVDALAKSTIKSLELLAPWCQPSNTPKLGFANDVITQAYKYAKAIDLSVVAAQKAFTVAEEAISLGDLIDTSTSDERQGYLVGMLELAKAGRDTATEAHEAFRRVRTDVDSLLKDAKEQPECEEVVLELSICIDGRWTTNKKAFGNLCSDLQNGIDDLHIFSQHISDFATWWNWMKMETSTQHARTERIRFNYNSLRQRAVIVKWKTLQQQFASYHDQIGKIQDCYPAFFIESREVRPQEELRVRQEQEQKQEQDQEQEQAQEKDQGHDQEQGGQEQEQGQTKEQEELREQRGQERQANFTPEVEESEQEQRCRCCVIM